MNCDPTGPSAEAACLAGSILRGSVVKGAAQFVEGDDEYPHNLNITVRVSDVLKTDSSSDPLKDLVPFEAVIEGFLPCCVCGTEPPEPSTEELFFFVTSKCNGNCSTQQDAPPLFELSPSGLGRGTLEVTEDTEAEVLKGIEATAAGIACDVLYCQSNPKCKPRDCPRILRTSNAIALMDMGLSVPLLALVASLMLVWMHE